MIVKPSQDLVVKVPGKNQLESLKPSPNQKAKTMEMLCLERMAETNVASRVERNNKKHA